MSFGNRCLGAVYTIFNASRPQLSLSIDREWTGSCGAFDLPRGQIEMEVDALTAGDASKIGHRSRWRSAGSGSNKPFFITSLTQIAASTAPASSVRPAMVKTCLVISGAGEA